MSPNNFAATDGNGFSGEMPEPDIQIITSGGRRIPAHSTVLVRNLVRFIRAWTNFNFTFKTGELLIELNFGPIIGKYISVLKIFWLFFFRAHYCRLRLHLFWRAYWFGRRSGGTRRKLFGFSVFPVMLFLYLFSFSLRSSEFPDSRRILFTCFFISLHYSREYSLVHWLIEISFCLGGFYSPHVIPSPISPSSTNIKIK